MNRPIAPEKIEEIKRRYLAGEKYEAIQAEMGISHSTIRHHIERLNLPMRRPERSKRVTRLQRRDIAHDLAR